MRKILKGIYHYLLFFMLIAFVVTCTMVLFVTVLSQSLHIEFTDENLNMAAKLTFCNVILLSILFTLIDFLRRNITTKKVKTIIADAAKKMVQGDFDIRIAPVNAFSMDDTFNDIIDCFNKMAEELAGVETLRTDFVANVSHEMKTPLSVLNNYGILLQNSGLEEGERIEYAKGVSEYAKKLADMITNILKLNRLEKQQIYPKTTEYDIGEQLCECLIAYESTWESKNIEIDTDIDDNIKINTDRELMTLVWNNLFSNAFKFTDEGGRVSVALKSNGEYVMARVADTGCGMNKDVGEHIFEKFYQGDTSHKTQGNGLGLALVKRVVDILKGEISVESEKGVGSTFIVKFKRY